MMNGIGSVGYTGAPVVGGPGHVEGAGAASKTHGGGVLSSGDMAGEMGFKHSDPTLQIPPPQTEGGFEEKHIQAFEVSSFKPGGAALIEALGMVMSDMAIEMRKQSKKDMIAHMKDRLAALDKKKEEQLLKADKLKMGAIMSGAINLGAAMAMGMPGLSRAAGSVKGFAVKVIGKFPKPPMPKISIKTPKLPSYFTRKPQAPPKKAEGDAKTTAPGTANKPAAAEADMATRLGEAQNSMMRMQALSMSMQGVAGSTDGFMQAEAAVHDAQITGHEKLETMAETKFQKAKGLAEEYQSFHQEVMSTLKDFNSQQRSIGEAINSKA